MRGSYFGTKFDTLLFDNHTVSHSVSIYYIGVMLDQHLLWETHIDCFCNKIARGITLLKMSCKFMSMQCLMYMYNAFIIIVLYLNHCIELWGNACELYLLRLRTFQKCSIRLINGAPYLEHCKPLAINLNTLIVDNIYYLAVVCFMHTVMYNNIVSCTFFVKMSASSYMCTRSHNLNFFKKRVNLTIRRKCITFVGVDLWNDRVTYCVQN